MEGEERRDGLGKKIMGDVEKDVKGGNIDGEEVGVGNVKKQRWGGGVRKWVYKSRREGAEGGERVLGTKQRGGERGRA